LGEADPEVFWCLVEAGFRVFKGDRGSAGIEAIAIRFSDAGMGREMLAFEMGCCLIVRKRNDG
jgi:hypothetical protein